MGCFDDEGNRAVDFDVGGVKIGFGVGTIGFGARPMALRRMLDLGVHEVLGERPMVSVWGGLRPIGVCLPESVDSLTNVERDVCMGGGSGSVAGPAAQLRALLLEWQDFGGGDCSGVCKWFRSGGLKCVWE